MKIEPTTHSTDPLGDCLETVDSLPMPALVLDDDGTLLQANRAWVARLGRLPAAQGPWEWLHAVSEEDRERVRRELLASLEGEPCDNLEIRLRDESGAVRVLDVCAGRVGSGQGDRLVVLASDATGRHREEERLSFMAGHDPLTGLANRRAFEEAVDRAVARAERGQKASLLMLDMDHLKSYNDTHGHLEGDQALVNFSLLLRRHVRAGDLLARLGGDEFGVLLEGIGVDGAAEIAERMRKAAAEEEFVAHARDHDLGVSAGLVAIESGLATRAHLDRADIALYAAKAHGRNRVCRWTDALGDQSSVDRVAGRVRWALREDGFGLVFQPVVNLATGEFAYFESLLRLRTPDDVVLMPAEFLPVAERLGLMPRLTSLVLEKVLAQLEAHPSLSLSLNLSGSDLADEILLGEFGDRLGASPDLARRLVFEIAENVLVGNPVAGRGWIERLRVHGARFVLDDFSSGVGVFVLLREAPVDQVKLASAVVDSLRDGPKAVAFVEALRELVESTGRSVVAACVEDDRMLDEVRSAGFTYCQGFRVATPQRDLDAFVRGSLPAPSSEA